MLKEDLAYLAAFGLAVAGSVGALAYGFGNGATSLLPVALAVAGLVAGQLVLMALAFRQDERREAALQRVKRDVAGFHCEIRRKTEGVQGQINALRQHGEGQSAAVLQGLAELKASYGALQGLLEARMAAPAVPEPMLQQAEPPAPEPEALPEFAPPPEPAFAEAPAAVAEPSPEAPAPEALGEGDEAFADQVNYALEPVVDMLTRRTAHYRMHLSLSFGGEELSNDQLLHHAGRLGKRPLLDMLAAREALELLAKLRQRDAELCVMVNIGAETLSDANALNALMGLRAEADPALAQGLVFELPHAMLAGLPEQALEGLAALARAGVVFALTQVSVSGLDLNAMSILNVRYVGLASGAIDAAGPSTALIGFAQMARLSRISVMVTGVSNPQMVAKLQAVARLACGPCFAMPRRVKRRRAAPGEMGLAA